MAFNTKKLSKALCFIAFGFGTGLSKRFPTSYATLLAVFIIFAISIGYILDHFLYFCILLLLVFFISILACQVAYEKLDGQTYPNIVLDKIFGCIVALLSVKLLLIMGVIDWPIISKITLIIYCVSIFLFIDCFFKKLRLKPNFYPQQRYFGLKLMLLSVINAICTENLAMSAFVHSSNLINGFLMKLGINPC